MNEFRLQQYRLTDNSSIPWGINFTNTTVYLSFGTSGWGLLLHVEFWNISKVFDCPSCGNFSFLYTMLIKFTLKNVQRCYHLCCLTYNTTYYQTLVTDCVTLLTMLLRYLKYYTFCGTQQHYNRHCLLLFSLHDNTQHKQHTNKRKKLTPFALKCFYQI